MALSHPNFDTDARTKIMKKNKAMKKTKVTKTAFERRRSLSPSLRGRRAAESLPPMVIGVSGNEEFLDQLAAIFAEQVLTARKAEREQQGEEGSLHEEGCLCEEGSLPDAETRFDSFPDS